MFLSHGISKKSLIKSIDLIRLPLLKVGQYDSIKVKMDSLEASLIYPIYAASQGYTMPAVTQNKY